MNKFLLVVLFSSIGHFVFGQSTALEVRAIFDTKCVSCHSGGSPAGNLDMSVSNGELYDRLVWGEPNNSVAKELGDKLIYPGRLDKSYLFKKINTENFEASAPLDYDTGHHMPVYPGDPLTDIEKEMIRQWILFGARETGETVDKALIESYYNEGGLEAFPDGAPDAPIASEGFQMKMGPFFLEPGGELEYFQKYELELPADQEVTRIDVIMSNYSHHFLLYAYDDAATAAQDPDGIIPDQNHTTGIRLVATVQEAQNIELPEGTAFFWKDDEILQFNSHYINYSQSLPYAAEVYLNVYTQPSGTAAQEMKNALIPNLGIFIPNDGEEHVFESQFSLPFDQDWYIWNMSSHTHKLGTDYDIFLRNSDGTQGEHIYESSCPNGEPGCPSPFYDYQHPPVKEWDPFLKVPLSEGYFMRASYVNNGPFNVGWGATSDDEMMLMGVMYTTSIDGLTSTEDPKEIKVLRNDPVPNPVVNESMIEIPNGFSLGQIHFYDAKGSFVKTADIPSNFMMKVYNSDFEAGMYFYEMVSKQGQKATGKMIIAR